MDFKKSAILGLALLMSIFYLSCGGGGGGGNGGGGTNVTQTGVFKDSNVAGIRYETSSGHFGVTDENGQYTYDSGDSVTFYVGGVSLGSTTARGVVLPIDLVIDGSSSSPQVLNIVRFLMMLDSDGIPDNGIEISAAVQAAADAWSQLDFNAPDFDTIVDPIIDECQTADGGDHNLPSATFAENHLKASLRCAYSGAFRGTFAGDASGRFGVVIDPQTGFVRGAAYSPLYELLTEGSGTEAISYDQNRAFITGFVDTGASFQGQLASADSMSGTWTDAFENGTFAGSRIGGAFGATHRYTGIALTPLGDNTGAILAMDVDSAGAITGIGYDIYHDSQFTFSGTLTGTDITATGSDGVEITGTLLPDDTFSGEWFNPNDRESGSFSGSGCRLN